MQSPWLYTGLDPEAKRILLAQLLSQQNQPETAPSFLNPIGGTPQRQPYTGPVPTANAQPLINQQTTAANKAAPPPPPPPVNVGRNFAVNPADMRAAEVPGNPLAIGPQQKLMLEAILPEIADRNMVTTAGALKNAGPNSGEGRQGKAGAKQTTKEGTVATSLVDPAEIEQFQERLQANPLFQQRAANLQGMREALKKLVNAPQERPDLDLTPLAALSDTWFGGGLAQASAAMEKNKRPKLTNKELMLALQKEIDRESDSLTKDQTEFLKAQLKNRSTDDLMLMLYGERVAKSGQMGQNSDWYKLAQLQLAERRIQETNEKDARAAYGQYLKGHTPEWQSLVGALKELNNTLGTAPTGHTPGYFKVPDTIAKLGNMIGVDVGGERRNWQDLSPEDQDFAANLAKIKNSVLQEYSGAVASDKEVQRHARALGDIKILGRPDLLRKELSDLAKAMGSADREREALLSLDPDAFKIYQSQKSKGQISGPEVFEGLDFGLKNNATITGPKEKTPAAPTAPSGDDAKKSLIDRINKLHSKKAE